jgi:hypothetical protein
MVKGKRKKEKTVNHKSKRSEDPDRSVGSTQMMHKGHKVGHFEVRTFEHQNVECRRLFKFLLRYSFVLCS